MENMSKYNLKKIWGRLRDYTFLISSFELLKVSILPIGSVVRVREGVEPVMIVNHCPDTKKQRQK